MSLHVHVVRYFEQMIDMKWRLSTLKIAGGSYSVKVASPPVKPVAPISKSSCGKTRPKKIIHELHHSMFRRDD